MYNGEKLLNQKGLAVGLIVLFIVLSTSPISMGSNGIKDKIYESGQETLYQQYSEYRIQEHEHSENNVIFYFAACLVQYSKTHFREYPGKHTGVFLQYGILCFNASLEKLTLSIIMNYTAEMNYTIGVPSLAPIVAFGLKIENYSEYIWRTFKLKHNGYAKQEGNISINISFDMEHIKPGDKFILRPTVAIVSDPYVYLSKDYQFYKYTSRLLRFIYYVPSLHKILLEKRLFPFIAEHGSSGIYGENTRIIILFQ